MNTAARNASTSRKRSSMVLVRMPSPQSAARAREAAPYRLALAPGPALRSQLKDRPPHRDFFWKHLASCSSLRASFCSLRLCNRSSVAALCSASRRHLSFCCVQAHRFSSLAPAGFCSQHKHFYSRRVRVSGMHARLSLSLSLSLYLDTARDEASRTHEHGGRNHKVITSPATTPRRLWHWIGWA